MKHILVSCAVLIAGLMPGSPARAADDSAGWSYDGDTGPNHWSEVSPDYALCQAGKMQSPVDLGEANATGELEISVDYEPSPLNLVNPGKTVQANFRRGSRLTSGGKVFNLVQAHFHTPSEHLVDGGSYPLVAHFVHASDEGELAVLGVLFEEGDAHTELQKIIDAMPAAGAGTTEVHGVDLDPAAMLPDELDVFRYMGSLTTPPCSEGVHWHVAEDELEASAAQIQALADAMGANARPVLPLHGRLLVAPE